MTDRYAVVGNPIAHSKSPQIHAAFARQTGQDISYTTLLAAVDAFTESVRRFQTEGGKGLNVTVPFKREAWELADSRSQRAERAGAVNTLTFASDGAISGDNTDGIGLVRDLVENHGCLLAGQRILLLGAGGAVRGVLGPLLESEPAAVVIGNRTADKAVRLAAEFASPGTVSGCGLNELADGKFDVVINGTAASLSGTVPVLPGGVFGAQALAYDMMYAAEPTTFMRWALRHGAVVAFDGLGMLVEQAAESFYVWRGVRPLTQPVLEGLRAHLGSA